MKKRIADSKAAKPSPSVGTTPVYKGSDKHKIPWQPGRKGSLCPKDLTLEDAQRLLAASTEYNGSRWAMHEGRPFRALQDAEGCWHGFPVGWVEVPAPLRDRWRKDKKFSRGDLKRYWLSERP